MSAFENQQRLPIFGLYDVGNLSTLMNLSEVYVSQVKNGTKRVNKIFVRRALNGTGLTYDVLFGDFEVESKRELKTA